MLKQEQVFELIKTEREFQEDLDVTSHLVLLDLYLTKAKEAWNVKGDNIPALQQVAKIAAIAVRALERAGGSEKLTVVGLR